jgi:protein O-mannosyl-transferase
MGIRLPLEYNLKVPMSEAPKQISPEGLAQEIKQRFDRNNVLPCAFLLGAGTSIESGIPSAKSMVTEWLEELFLREVDKEDFNEWQAWAIKNVKDYDKDDPGASYAKVYDMRYKNDTTGFGYHESKIDGKLPSLGYYYLAKIAVDKICNLILTTNFDNLVVDTITSMSESSPLVCSHESLVEYIQTQPNRPTIVKIHRDLLLGPKSSSVDTKKLPSELKNAVRNLCSQHTLVIIGYGGNDNGLMELLEELPDTVAPNSFYWCYYKPDGMPTERIQNLVIKREGYFVPIDGFDDLMGILIKEMEIKPSDVLEQITKRYEARKRAFIKVIDDAIPVVAIDKTHRNAEKIDVERKCENWLEWDIEARAESNKDRRNAIYKAGIEQFPNSAHLINSYAIFLHEVGENVDVVESMYKRAIEIDPNDSNILGNYAVFLADVREKYDKAEEMYKSAIELNPGHANNLGNYAVFLADVREKYDEAEVMYKRAIESDPKRSSKLGNYAVFLANVREKYDEAEVMYKRAIELDPKNAINLCNYAIFLTEIRGKHDEAEAMYNRAIELNPKNAKSLNNFAAFLSDIREKHNEAEVMCKRAAELDPNNIVIIKNYERLKEMLTKNNGGAGRIRTAE